jgi:hypothetical protein
MALSGALSADESAYPSRHRLDVQPSGVADRPRVVTARLLMASALAAATLGACSTAHSPDALPPAPTRPGPTSAAPTSPGPTSHSATASTQHGHTAKTLGFVVTRRALPDGYRIVLAPAKHHPDDSWSVIPGRATVTYVVPRTFVPTASLLSGVIQVTTQGHRLTGVVVIG